MDGKTQIQFRCTGTFKENVEEWAEEAGLTVSDYLREAAREKAREEDLL